MTVRFLVWALCVTGLYGAEIDYQAARQERRLGAVLTVDQMESE